MEQTPSSAPEQPERGLAHIGEIMDQLLDVTTKTSQPLEPGRVFEGDEPSTASREADLMDLDAEIVTLGRQYKELVKLPPDHEERKKLEQVKQAYNKAQMDRVQILSPDGIFKPKK